MLVSSAHRHGQASRTVDQPLCKHGQRDVDAFQQHRRRPFAGEAEAPPALATFPPG